MKESSGELSMTVVVIVAAVLLITILSALLPNMSNFISDKWKTMTDSQDNPGTIVLPMEDLIK